MYRWCPQAAVVCCGYFTNFSELWRKLDGIYLLGGNLFSNVLFLLSQRFFADVNVWRVSLSVVVRALTDWASTLMMMTATMVTANKSMSTESRHPSRVTQRDTVRQLTANDHKTWHTSPSPPLQSIPLCTWVCTSGHLTVPTAILDTTKKKKKLQRQKMTAANETPLEESWSWELYFSKLLPFTCTAIKIRKEARTYSLLLTLQKTLFT